MFAHSKKYATYLFNYELCGNPQVYNLIFNDLPTKSGEVGKCQNKKKKKNRKNEKIKHTEEEVLKVDYASSGKVLVTLDLAHVIPVLKLAPCIMCSKTNKTGKQKSKTNDEI